MDYNDSSLMSHGLGYDDNPIQYTTTVLYSSSGFLLASYSS